MLGFVAQKLEVFGYQALSYKDAKLLNFETVSRLLLPL